MTDIKKKMAEAAVLYYEKKYTQQEIAEILGLSRQTVSKLLTDAVEKRVVEITIHDPENDCHELEEALCRKFGLKAAVVCSATSKNDALRHLSTIRGAVGYLTPILKKGKLKIAISWGRTVESLIAELEPVETVGNTVFPLFGATDNCKSYFSPNELARIFAEKLSAELKSTWFPYLPDTEADARLFRKTSYFRSVAKLWANADLAIVGIGDTEVLRLFETCFGHDVSEETPVGDIATHFFADDGTWIPLYKNKLCASLEDLKQTQTTVAVACGDGKTACIRGALRTGIIDVMITDEYIAGNLVAQE